MTRTVSIQSIEAIVADPALPVANKAERIAAALHAQPDVGIDVAVQGLLSTSDERVASFLANYLALFPGLRNQKTQVAARLRSDPALTGAAARLVPWLPADMLEGFISDYRARPDKRSPLYSVMFEIATYFPGMLRSQLAFFDSPSIRLGLLSGAPDVWIAEHVERWRTLRDPQAIDALARFRTSKSADVIGTLRDEIERERWECWLEMAGRLPGGGPASFGPASMGFVSASGTAPHVMGGRITGQVPLCPVCTKPAERVLTVSSSAFPVKLCASPSLFWFPCNCNVLDAITVQERAEGRRIFFVPGGDSIEVTSLVPGACSMQVEPHPNVPGVSIDATGGFSRHQIAGLPVWNHVRAHPYCPECRQPMKFLASVDSGMTPFGRLGFSGTLFGFWCDPCAVSTTIRQP